MTGYIVSNIVMMGASAISSSIATMGSGAIAFIIVMMGASFITSSIVMMGASAITSIDVQLEVLRHCTDGDKVLLVMCCGLKQTEALLPQFHVNIS